MRMAKPTTAFVAGLQSVSMSLWLSDLPCMMSESQRMIVWKSQPLTSTVAKSREGFHTVKSE